MRNHTNFSRKCALTPCVLACLGVFNTACGDAGERSDNVDSTGGHEAAFPAVDRALFAEAALVVTGTASESIVYRSASDRHIYTVTRFEVTAAEKGAGVSEVFVRTRGGRLPNDEFEYVTHQPDLWTGEVARLYLGAVDQNTLGLIRAEAVGELDAEAVYGVIGGESGKQFALADDQALETGCTAAHGYCVSKWSNGSFVTPMAMTDMPINVSYDPTGATVVLGSTGALRLAMDAWEDDPSSRVDFHFDGTTTEAGYDQDGKNTVFWTGFIGNILASTAMYGVGTQILEFDMGINFDTSTAPFATTPTAGKYLLQSTLIHEFGHGIGLGDVTYTAQIMVGNGTKGGSRTTLQWGDRNGVRALYPQAEIPAVGDFNGDGREDIVAFTNEWSADVWVAKSTGSSYGAAEKWHDFVGPIGEAPMVGNFNGDPFDDVIAFTQGETKQVWVCLSNGVNAFGACTQWHGNFAPVGTLPRVGDVNGDGKDDILSFPRNATSTSAQVRVALSNGSNAFGASSSWHPGFPTGGGRSLWVADMDNDFRDDLISIADGVENSQTVSVALSNGTGFGSVQQWNSTFCGTDTDRAIVGYVDSDHRADVVCVGGAIGGQNPSVWYSTGTGFTFGGLLPFGIGSLGKSYFVSKAGTFKGSIVEFQHCSFADVNVMRKTGSGFTWAQPTRWQDFFAPRPDPCF